MAVGEIGGCCKGYYFVLTLVREISMNFKVYLLCEPCNTPFLEIGGCCKGYYFVLTLVREKSGNFKVHLLCEPCNTPFSSYCIFACLIHINT